MDIKVLIQKAIDVKKNAYVPYSGFRVGASVLTKTGEIFTGCNIESASYTPTICAERTAIFKAVSEGYRDFEAVVVVGDSGFTYPCGVCRQVIKEFGEETKIIVAKSVDEYREYTLKELLPHSFGPEDLEVKK